MKIQKAWGNLALENTKLAWIALSSGLSLFVVLGICWTLAARKVVVIERACTTTVLDQSSTAVPDRERDAFITEALRQRFDSKLQASAAFLSTEELLMKERDDKELKTRNMNSTILVNSVKRLGDGKFEVDADRVVSVGEIRSALRFPLVLDIGVYSRSAENPFGLILVKSQPRTKDNSGGEK